MQSTRVINSSNIPFEIYILELKGIGGIWQNGLCSDGLGSNPASIIYGLFEQIDDLATGTPLCSFLKWR